MSYGRSFWYYRVRVACCCVRRAGVDMQNATREGEVDGRHPAVDGRQPEADGAVGREGAA